jgi:NADPH:quinone reductase-like Zn-dependent oxidoreductase
MKQIIVNEFGGHEKLILQDVPMPSVGDGQIVIVLDPY